MHYVSYVLLKEAYNEAEMCGDMAKKRDMRRNLGAAKVMTNIKMLRADAGIRPANRAQTRRVQLAKPHHDLSDV